MRTPQLPDALTDRASLSLSLSNNPTTITKPKTTTTTTAYPGSRRSPHQF
ncbi:hypothetical protein [uncultured Thiodictyon sp.]|nr:hypothetical protein [uncultured Thiodictyon sp.]